MLCFPDGVTICVQWLVPRCSQTLALWKPSKVSIKRQVHQFCWAANRAESQQSQEATFFFSILPILFLCQQESLVSSNLNSKQLMFHGAHPNVHTSSLNTQSCIRRAFCSIENLIISLFRPHNFVFKNKVDIFLTFINMQLFSTDMLPCTETLIFHSFCP